MSEEEKEGTTRRKKRKTSSLFSPYFLLDVLDDRVDVDLVVRGLDGDRGALGGRAGGLVFFVYEEKGRETR